MASMARIRHNLKDNDMGKKILYAATYLYFVLDLFVSVPSQFSYLKILALLCLFFPLPFLLSLFIKKEIKLLKVWKGLSSSLYSAFLLVFVFNMLVLVMPGIARAMPASIVNYYQLENLQEVRAQTIEYIEQNPFVKFQPNVTARSQGLRGDTTQFQYTWKTDEWGFKNPKGRTNKSSDVLFIGNSFTEGMGVKVHQTLPSQFEQMSGKTAYNLGVQGYAPTQMLGTYELYADELKPNKVYMVYYSTIFEREHKFLDLDQARETKDFTGGIGNISERENEREIKAASQSRRIFTSILITGYVYLQKKREMAADQEGATSEMSLSVDLSKYPILESYKAEIEDGRNAYMVGLIEQVESKGVAWQNTTEVVQKVKNLCDDAGQDFALVYIPRRASVYYKAVTNDGSTQFIDDVELKAFAEFCQSNGITLIDPTDDVIAYTREQMKGNDSKALPYLEIDRHMSPNGYKIVAQKILKNSK